MRTNDACHDLCCLSLPLSDLCVCVSTGKKIVEHDLIVAIKIPFDDNKNMYFSSGIDGFPAYGFRPGSKIVVPYRLYLPEKLYPEFVIVTTVQVESGDGGMIFAVVNPAETVIQLGLQVSSAGKAYPEFSNVSLYYTDVNTHMISLPIARFMVPTLENKWAQLIVKVTIMIVAIRFKLGACQT